MKLFLTASLMIFGLCASAAAQTGPTVPAVSKTASHIFLPIPYPDPESPYPPSIFLPIPYPDPESPYPPTLK